MSLSREKEKETILTICVGLLVIYVLTRWRWPMLVYLSIVMGLIGMFSAYLTSKISWAWMKLAEAMGFVMSKVILSALFFLILVPVALLSRLKRKDPLMLKKKTKGTYFIERNHTYSPDDLTQAW